MHPSISPITSRLLMMLLKVVQPMTFCSGKVYVYIEVKLLFSLLSAFTGNK